MTNAILRQVIALIEPTVLLWLLLIVLTVWLVVKRQAGAAVVAFLALALVSVIGSTGVPGSLLSALERPYAGVKLESLPVADAIVLLGGGAAPSRFEAQGVHLTLAGDRVVMANELYRLKKAPVVLVGGNANKLDKVIRVEGEFTRDLLSTWGLPADAIIPLGINQDTHDEALKVAALAKERGWHHFLLVTSANHMRRASAVFRAQGLDVTPVACNFLTTVATAPPPPGVSFPHYDGFVKTAIWLHEVIGWWGYRQRGWIKAGE